MSHYHVTPLPKSLTDEVRLSHRSPGYGHPVHIEMAGGTGPCRQCLSPFLPGTDRRILFTHRPVADHGTITAPGPVFIHEQDCERYDASTFPPGLKGFPLAIEARGSQGRVLEARIGAGEEAVQLVEELLEGEGVTHLYLRHAEAGCFIARVDPQIEGLKD